MMNLSSLDPTIAGYLIQKWTGQADNTALNALADWERSNQDHSAIEAKLYEIWRLAGLPSEPSRAEMIRMRVLRNLEPSLAAAFSPQYSQHRTEEFSGWHQTDALNPAISDQTKVVQMTRRKSRTANMVSIVAVACFLALAGMSWLSLATKQGVNSEMTSYTTRNGERAKVRLPDGSLVSINSGSTITYAKHFDKNSREVYLDGEAIFTVSRSEGSPFVVHSRSASVKVLGTVFGVRHYATDSVTRVVVAEGRVGVGTDVLAAGEAVRIGGSGQPRKEYNADISVAFAWTNGRIVFPEVTLRDAIPELERWYGISIRVDDASILTHRFSATFDAESSAEALQVLAVLLHATAVWNGSIVTLYSEVSSI